MEADKNTYVVLQITHLKIEDDNPRQFDRVSIDL